jgi:hypothetical protein
MALYAQWADPNDVGHFGKTPLVRIRLHNEATDGREFWPNSSATVLEGLYGRFADSIGEVTVVPFENTYEQWVSLETPSAPLRSEPVEDRAYAFHRALDALNTFLMSMDLAISDLRVSRISTQEIGPVVFRGAYTRDGKWVRLGDLLMHPDAYPFPVPVVPFKSIQRQFEDVLKDLSGGRPFMLANLWHGRALRALRIRGDMADAVVNLQTAVESMMYDLLRALMVDEGASSTEIDTAVAAELQFKSLVGRQLAPRLGGNWDPNSHAAFGSYWSKLYQLRNRVVHGGYSPSGAEANGALDAFFAVREFVSERLWDRSRTYPRALLAKVGSNGLARRGWMTARMRAQCAKFLAEPYPFYWPRDIANRS